MSQRNRFARAGAVAGAFVLAVAMTPRADGERPAGGTTGGGSRSSGSASSHTTSSGGSRSSSGGHTVTSSGPRSSPSHDGARGGYTPSSGGIRTERGGRGGWYGGRGGGGTWGGHSSWGGHYYPRWYGDWYWGFTPYWASYGWLWGWPWYYDPFFSDWRYVQIYGDGYYGGGYGWRSTGPWASQFGRVKTDVEPEEAELYLNGKYIGTADDFDGHPDYLYLEPGTYKLEFRLNGYRTWSDDLTIQKGEVVRMRHELDRDKEHGRLDAFLPHAKEMPSGRFFDASGNPVSPDAGRRRHTARAPEDRDGPIGIDDRNDRDRPRTDVEAVPDDDDRPLGGTAAPEPDTRKWDRDRDRDRDGDRDRVRDAAPATPARARLRWKVTPDDAAVWVDDQYAGTADELSSRPRGTMLQPGKHTVTVVRPGYRSRTVDVEAKSGEAVDVIVELEK